MNNAELTVNNATMAGEITVYNFDVMSREYISASTEYLLWFGIRHIPVRCSRHLQSWLCNLPICRFTHGNMCQTIAVNVFSTETGESKESQLRVITLIIQPLSPR
ncbi:tail fiber assembly protein-like protein [Escherichia coli]|nr:tail fiber assembly protein-like protein [Escherichia coli]